MDTSVDFDTFEGILGEHINAFAERAILTRQTRINRAKDFQATFNDVTVYVTILSTVDSLLKDYETEKQRLHTLYFNSEEYKEKEKQTLIKADNNVSEWNTLMKSLPKLNLKSHNDVLAFLSKYCDTMNYIPALNKEPKMHESFSIVTNFLVDGGYIPNDNVNEKFNEHDEANFARYIIGQVLNFLLKRLPPPPVFDTMYEQYKKSFKIA